MVVVQPVQEYIEVTKIVQSYIKTPILHIYYGRIPDEKIDENTKYAYILRRNTTPIGKIKRK